jgi:opacity protein-like surface antigen
MVYVLRFEPARKAGPARPARAGGSQCLATLMAVLVLAAALADALLGVIATSSSAIADDLFAPAPSPVFGWTGLYVGGHVGGAWANNDWFFPYDSINSVAQNPTGIPYQTYFPGTRAGLRDAIRTGYQLPTVGPFNVSSGSNSASSLLAGVQIGYNYQIKNWVLGVEGEASWAGLQGSNLDPNFPTINHTYTDFIGVLGGRLGYAWDRVLLYGKAGGAWAHDKYSVYSNTTFTVGSGSPAPVTVTTGTMVDAATVNRFGYMLGAGVEYALTPQWSVKAEYEYLDFGWQRTTLTPTTTVVSPYDEDIRQRIQLAMIGFNYKLDPALGAASAPAHPLFDQVGKFDPHRLYGGAEYLRWWVKGAPLSVPLVTTGPESTAEGSINSNEATILYGAPFSPATGGNDTQNFDPLSGVRLWFGYWLDDTQRLAVEAGGFALQKAEADYNISSDSTGSPALGIPEYNSIFYLGEGRCNIGVPNCGTGVGEDRSPVSVPDELAGSIAIKNTLQLWGLHANAVVNVVRTATWEVSALGGFRYLNLNEDFNMYSTLMGVSGSSFAGQSGYTDDDFATWNQFYGALLGLRAHGKLGPFSLESTLTAALGVNHETISINGYYQAYGFFNESGPYGIFATPANSGTTSSNKFAVVPEVQVKLGYDITPAVRVTVGYTFLYWSNVVRPTDQIDRNLIKGQFYQEDPYSTSLAYPQRLDKTTDFYAQGVSVGLSARF